MADLDPSDARRSGKSTSREAAQAAPDTEVMQVEKRDFVDLVPTDRLRAQSLRGFDPEYTDIVDYIVRCTHRIWDERDVGLIYTHYSHNAVVYSSLGTTYNREDVVRATIQRIAELPDRRGMAAQVIWRGDDVSGFYTSHLVTSTGRHTEPGPYGAPTGRAFTTRTIADCMVFENRIYREWLVRDNMAVLRQLGIDPAPVAERMAADHLARGFQLEEIGENGRLLGQYPPDAEPDLSLARTETERACLRWLHDVYNRRLYGALRNVYAPNVMWHGPGMRTFYGVGASLTQVMKLAGMMPDLVFLPQHVCSLSSVEGGEKVAIRWIMDGHHLGHGALGPPTGYRLFVMGMSHFHVVDGKVVEEWTLYDELALLVQLKLGVLCRSARPSHG